VTEVSAVCPGAIVTGFR